MRLAILLCLAAVCGSAFASRPDLFDASGDAGRALLQDATACNTAITHCSACRYQFFRGTVTRAICTACTNGYVPKALGTACWCAAGFKQSGTSCADCGQGSWCPGSKSTPTADPVPCGAHMNTTSSNAKSVRECLVNPGFGWSSTDGQVCNNGFYNPGNNNRRCSKCPGGLDTSVTGSETPDACVAPPGYYYLRGKAVACAQGSWKNTYENADCNECGDGTTTEPNAVAKQAAAGADCLYLQPGYFANLTAGTFTAGTTNGTLCPEHTYRTGTTIHTDTAAQKCVDCAPGLKTLPGVTGAKDSNECQAPPGWGYDATNANATTCPNGEYKAGWNRQPCIACGTGFVTEPTADAGATSSDECIIQPGWNSTTADGTNFVSAPCPVDSYGRPEKTYGLIALGCTKCIDNTHTDGATAQTNSSACGTLPGYGYYNGEATQCSYGTYNPGNNQSPCTSCGVGKNTTSGDGAGLLGATDASQCLAAQGYQLDGAGTPQPCDKGHYKDTVANISCLACPAKTTTSLESTAVALSDCDTCQAGFEAPTSYNVSDPASQCSICASGYYSKGIDALVKACTQCASPTKGDYIGGTMVSRRGITDQEMCLQQFPTLGTVSKNSLEWDILSDNKGSLVAQNSYNTLSTCQDACKLSTTCFYFQFDYNNNKNCSFLQASVAPPVGAQPNFGTDGGANYWVLLEVKPGSYATYQVTDANAADIGDQIATYSTFADAKTACDGASTCAGLSKTGATSWRTFAGKKWLNFIGKVKVYGESVDPWIAEPTGVNT